MNASKRKNVLTYVQLVAYCGERLAVSVQVLASVLNVCYYSAAVH